MELFRGKSLANLLANQIGRENVAKTGAADRIRDFWDYSTNRQYRMIFIVNMATFLQGASVVTSAVSLPRMPTNESQNQNDTTWPADFVVTENDAYWISKYIKKYQLGKDP